MSVTIDSKKSLILGRSIAGISGAVKDFPIDTTVFRMVVGLSSVFSGNLYNRLLRPLLTVISIPLLLAFLGKRTEEAKTYYLPQVISLTSLFRC